MQTSDTQALDTRNDRPFELAQFKGHHGFRVINVDFKRLNDCLDDPQKTYASFAKQWGISKCTLARLARIGACSDESLKADLSAGVMGVVTALKDKRYTPGPSCRYEVVAPKFKNSTRSVNKSKSVTGLEERLALIFKQRPIGKQRLLTADEIANGERNKIRLGLTSAEFSRLLGRCHTWWGEVTGKRKRSVRREILITLKALDTLSLPGDATHARIPSRSLVGESIIPMKYKNYSDVELIAAVEALDLECSLAGIPRYGVGTAGPKLGAGQTRIGMIRRVLASGDNEVITAVKAGEITVADATVMLKQRKQFSSDRGAIPVTTAIVDVLQPDAKTVLI